MTIEIRCKKCNALLFKVEAEHLARGIIIKCRSCKYVNKF